MRKDRAKHGSMKSGMKVIGRILVALILCFYAPVSGRAQAEEVKELKVTFIDVGQGDSMLLESQGQYMLIDGGPPEAGGTVTNFLKNKGITKLDYLVITHAHGDHFGGLKNVIENIQVDKVMKTPIYSADTEYQKLLLLIEQKKIPTIIPTTTSIMPFGTAKITIIAPNSYQYDSVNDTSIAFRVENGSNSFLFSGDIEAISEQEILNLGYNVKADVLKVPHHSALTSSTQAFLDKVNPSISVITCGVENQGGFPRFTTMEKLRHSNIYRTDLNSTVTMVSDGTEIKVDKAPYAYAEANIDTIARTVANTENKESTNLRNLKVVSDSDQFSLYDVNADESNEKTFADSLTLKFNADYGISSMDMIEVACVPSEVDTDLNNLKWTKLDGNTFTINEVFSGCVYVRYKNKLGNTVVRKTDGFEIKSSQITNCAITSNLSRLALVDISAKNDYSNKASLPVNVQFSAAFGYGEDGTIEYMPVKRGEAFNPDGKWIQGKQVLIQKDFIGSIYVRFSDSSGKTIVKKTTGFAYISKKPINTKVSSRIAGIKFTASNSSKIIKVNSQVTLKFSADFGASGKKSIQYVLVKSGIKAAKNEKWMKGEKVTIKKGFKGQVKVKFTDNKGNSAVCKTNTFTVK